MSYGVLTGKKLVEVYQKAKLKGFAIPAVNVTSTSYINATLETAAKANSYVIIQMAYERSQFFIGNTVPKENHYAATMGAIAGARYVHQAAQAYKVPVILHTDHCTKKNLGWIDELISANHKHYNQYGYPLFSSHMLDLSQESLQDNISISSNYMKKLKALDMGLEIELGVTGGIEGDMDNSQVDESQLYTQPEDVWMAFNSITDISSSLTIAASFGNVHGVYKPGNVVLKPRILDQSQKLVSSKIGEDKPINFVFHGGSGSTDAEIQEAISYGVIKMNIDTDLQWAYWRGVKNYYEEKKDYLQSQIGNPEDDSQGNKKYYDSPKWMRKAEESYKESMYKSYEKLNAIDTI